MLHADPLLSDGSKTTSTGSRVGHYTWRFRAPPTSNLHHTIRPPSRAAKLRPPTLSLLVGIYFGSDACDARRTSRQHTHVGDDASPQENAWALRRIRPFRDRRHRQEKEVLLGEVWRPPMGSPCYHQQGLSRSPGGGRWQRIPGSVRSRLWRFRRVWRRAGPMCS